MKVGPRYKICKRLGSGVFEKCQTQKFMLSEERSQTARRGGRRPKALSDFGKQLKEKQKVRYTYGISERQLSRYAKEARTKTGSDGPGDRFYKTLESRLDNVVYRLGLAATRRLARQMVSHGHIVLNEKRITVPSAMVREGDVVSVREGSREKTLFTAATDRMKTHKAPTWLSFDVKKLSGEVKGAPQSEEAASLFDLPAVLEFYSK